MNLQHKPLFFHLELSLLILLLPFVGKAQVENEKKESNAFNENVVVISSFNPVVNEAYKLNENPTITDTSVSDIEFTYDFAPKRFSTRLSILPIKAARVVGEPIAKLYNSYIKAGLGTYLTGYVDVFHSSSRSRNTLYNVRLKHYGSFGQISEYGNSSFFDTDLKVYGKKIWKNFSIDGSAFYSRTKNYYYGYKPATINLPSTGAYNNIKNYAAVWNRLGMQARYAGIYADEDALHHYVKMGLYNLHGKGGTNELNLNIEGSVHKYFHFFGDERQNTGVTLLYDHYFNNYEFEENPYDAINPYAGSVFPAELNAGTFTLEPFMAFRYKELSLRLSIKTTAAFANETSFHFHPVARAQFSIMNRYLDVYGGIDGGLKKNSLQTLRSENPFIGPYIHLPFTNHRLNLFAGLQSSPLSNLDIVGEIRYEYIKDLPFFLLDTKAVLTNVYTATFDDVARWNFHGEVSYSYHDIFQLGANINYFIYHLSNLAEAYHRPSLEAGMNMAYTIAQKVIIEFYPYFVGKRKGWNGSKTINLKPHIDLNLHITYRYSKQLAFFAKMNNLAFQRYDIYTNYPSQKLMFMLGGSYAF